MNTCENPLFEHEYGSVRNPMSRPPLTATGKPLPALCLMSFMGDALADYVAENGCPQISVLDSEARDYPIYQASVDGREVCLVQAPVGAPAAAIMADLLIASGVNSIVACGGCGVLQPISSGLILIPDTALRDEGTSYHYVEPSREITIDPDLVSLATSVLADHGVNHRTCKVWTTDGFFRETRRTVELRRRQLCDAVDMECAALAAVAQAYGARFVELLYSGDSLCNPDKHDDRNWIANCSARAATLRLALAVLSKL